MKKLMSTHKQFEKVVPVSSMKGNRNLKLGNLDSNIGVIHTVPFMLEKMKLLLRGNIATA